MYKKTLKMILSLALFWGMASSPALSQGLPEVGSRPFFGCFGGKEIRGGVYRVAQSGVLEVRVVRKKDKFVYLSGGFDVNYYIEEQSPTNPDQWIAHKYKPEDYRTKQKADKDADELKFVVVTNKETEVEINYTFKGKKVFVEPKILNKGKAKGKLRVYFRAYARSVYPHLKDGATKKDWDAATKGDQVSLTFNGRKTAKVKGNAMMTDFLKKHESLVAKGIVGASLKYRLTGHEKVSIALEQSSGAYIDFKPHPTNKRIQGGGLFFVYKDPKKKGRGPWFSLSAGK